MKVNKTVWDSASFTHSS